ncbi:hypothetical protein G7Y89_g3468 [Cudoniella acicularis]|uniref:Uncharacterized protein n=1 Tax=Cudoniella acicularis TaxID=354080 RepID=A0A8H4RUA7_9HELO|nr:hypothetical protein G7Y89_g3468 [Cudoniella acicularis]
MLASFSAVLLVDRTLAQCTFDNVWRCLDGSAAAAAPFCGSYVSLPVLTITQATNVISHVTVPTVVKKSTEVLTSTITITSFSIFTADAILTTHSTKITKVPAPARKRRSAAAPPPLKYQSQNPRALRALYTRLSQQSHLQQQLCRSLQFCPKQLPTSIQTLVQTATQTSSKSSSSLQLSSTSRVSSSSKSSSSLKTSSTSKSLSLSKVSTSSKTSSTSSSTSTSPTPTAPCVFDKVADTNFHSDYHIYYTGYGYSKAGLNPGNPSGTGVYPTYTFYPYQNIYADTCLEILTCAGWANTAEGQSFSVFYATSEGTWLCNIWPLWNNDTSAFSVRDIDVGWSYGYSIGREVSAD